MAKGDKKHPLRKLDEAWLHALDVSWKGKSKETLICEIYNDIMLLLEPFTQN